MHAAGLRRGGIGHQRQHGGPAFGATRTGRVEPQRGIRRQRQPARCQIGFCQRASGRQRLPPDRAGQVHGPRRDRLMRRRGSRYRRAGRWTGNVARRFPQPRQRPRQGLPHGDGAEVRHQPHGIAAFARAVVVPRAPLRACDHHRQPAARVEAPGVAGAVGGVRPHQFAGEVRHPFRQHRVDGGDIQPGATHGRGPPCRGSPPAHRPAWGRQPAACGPAR